jgi:hypothetical protein
MAFRSGIIYHGKELGVLLKWSRQGIIVHHDWLALTQRVGTKIQTQVCTKQYKVEQNNISERTLWS